MKLTNLYNEILDEDYPSSFNMEEFKTLTSFNKRIKYCEDNLKRISSGSSRIVYAIDNEKVLKLAKNNKGLQQNEVEISYGQYSDLDDIVAKIFDYENNNLWVEMELARKVSVADFKRITEFDFKIYSMGIANYGNEVNQQKNKMKYPKLDSEITQSMWDDEFVKSIFSFIGSYDVPVGDLTRLNSYGIVKRDGEDIIVIIDYGLTHDIYDSYYS
jgi:hypothetical protein|tara:strand:+ start:99 stop:743 length:645 start_codon:yes stop_codon:yes gene_type:complete